MPDYGREQVKEKQKTIFIPKYVLVIGYFYTKMHSCTSDLTATTFLWKMPQSIDFISIHPIAFVFVQFSVPPMLSPTVPIPPI